MPENSNIDCIKGREAGCQTYCCRLLIRLDPEERKPATNGLPAPGFIEKSSSGLCIHLDPESYLCAIWENRPRVCREYSCNSDYLLQVALREPVSSMVCLVKKAQTVFIPKENFIRIPVCSNTFSDQE